MKFSKFKIPSALLAITITTSTLTVPMNASALDSEGKTYEGNAAYIGTYMASNYFGNSAFQVTFRYNRFDADGTYEDEETGKTMTIDYNDTFQFLVFDTAWSGWDKTIAGPNGVNLTTPLTSADLKTDTTYTVMVPIATIERALSTGDNPYGINLQLGGVGDTSVYVESISYVWWNQAGKLL